MPRVLVLVLMVAAALADRGADGLPVTPAHTRGGVDAGAGADNQPPRPLALGATACAQRGGRWQRRERRCFWSRTTLAELRRACRSKRGRWQRQQRECVLPAGTDGHDASGGPARCTAQGGKWSVRASKCRHDDVAAAKRACRAQATWVWEAATRTCAVGLAAAGAACRKNAGLWDGAAGRCNVNPAHAAHCMKLGGVWVAESGLCQLQHVREAAEKGTGAPRGATKREIAGCRAVGGVWTNTCDLSNAKAFAHCRAVDGTWDHDQAQCTEQPERM